jgi:WD40 repeat protein
MCLLLFYLAALGIDCEDRIRSIAISPSEETAALAVSGSQIVALDLAHANVKDDTNAFTSMALHSHGPPSGLGCGPGHRTESSAILSIDMAVRKPLVATVGVDNTVRIWNYVERTCEVMKVFPEGPTSIAFHPSGFQLLVGFADKLRLQNVSAHVLCTWRNYLTLNIVLH